MAQPRRLLLVEDDPLLRVTLAEVLYEAGFAVLEAEDAESALGWPARAGKLVLTIALDRVADYYRIR